MVSRGSVVQGTPLELAPLYSSLSVSGCVGFHFSLVQEIEQVTSRED